MKVLVTGAAGLLGRYVCRQLLERGDEVVAVDDRSRYRLFGEDRAPDVPAELEHPRCRLVERDFASDEVTRLAVDGSVRAIVHAAAQTSHPRSIAIPIRDFEINAEGTLHLLEALRLAPPRQRPRLVHVSTAKVYGEHVSLRDELTESNWRFVFANPRRTRERYPWLDAVEGTLLGVSERCPLGDGTILTPFGVSKAAADLYVQQYAKLYGLDALCVRPGCFTAPGSRAVEEQNWEPRLVAAMVAREAFPVYGHGGRQVRDVLHAADLADLVVRAIDQPDPWRGEVLNAAGGPRNSTSIREAADLVEDLTGRRGELEDRPAREGDWAWYVGSNRRAYELLDWAPTTPVRETFRQLCEEAGA